MAFRRCWVQQIPKSFPFKTKDRVKSNVEGPLSVRVPGKPLLRRENSGSHEPRGDNFLNFAILQQNKYNKIQKYKIAATRRSLLHVC